jgi:hypothetical protein
MALCGQLSRLRQYAVSADAQLQRLHRLPVERHQCRSAGLGTADGQQPRGTGVRRFVWSERRCYLPRTARFFSVAHLFLTSERVTVDEWCPC